jgi:hypothetical protein
VLEDRVVPAGLVNWSYDTTVSPTVILGSGTGGVMFKTESSPDVQGTSDIVLAQMQTFAPQPSTISDVPYTIGLNITDTSSKTMGTLDFSAEISGSVTSQSAHLLDTYLGSASQSMTLGSNVYTATEYTFNSPGAPSSTTPGTIGVHIAVTPAPDNTTTMLTSSTPGNVSVTNQPVTFTATVKDSGPGTGTPTGSVSFFVDGSTTPVDTEKLVGGMATSKGLNLSAGAHTIKAVYSGATGSFNGSTSADLTQTVKPIFDPSLSDPSQNLQNVINKLVPQGTNPPTLTLDVASDGQAQAVIKALDGLAAQHGAVVVDLNLAALPPGQVYTAETVKLPANLTLDINGSPGTTIDPATPAFTVKSGTVMLSNMTFVTTGNAPTILVTGGNLVLRHDTIEETTAFTQSAIKVTGGNVDLGTVADPGHNTLEVTGQGNFITTSAAGPISAIGDTFILDGKTLDTTQQTDDFSIAQHIRDGRGNRGVGLVTFVAGNAYVTAGGASLQRTIDAVPAGTTIHVQAGVQSGNYKVGNKVLTIAFQNGPTLSLQQDLPGGLTTLRVTGAPGANDITFDAGARKGSVRVAIDGFPTGTFEPTGRIIAHGGGDDADITVSDKIKLPALLFADGIDGWLRGGGGPTLEVGGGGDFTILEGGSGGNVLIAGPGRAALEGSSTGDLLIGGTTTYDQVEVALMAILKEWDSSASLTTRVGQLTGTLPGGVNGSVLLTTGHDGTVSSNGGANRLDGEGGLDLYFADLTGAHTDLVFDASSGDVVIPLGS